MSIVSIIIRNTDFCSRPEAFPILYLLIPVTSGSHVFSETQCPFFIPATGRFINRGNQSQPDRSGSGSIRSTSTLRRIRHIAGHPSTGFTGLARTYFMNHGDWGFRELHMQ